MRVRSQAEKGPRALRKGPLPELSVRTRTGITAATSGSTTASRKVRKELLVFIRETNIRKNMRQKPAGAYLKVINKDFQQIVNKFPCKEFQFVVNLRFG